MISALRPTNQNAAHHPLSQIEYRRVSASNIPRERGPRVLPEREVGWIVTVDARAAGINSNGRAGAGCGAFDTDEMKPRRRR